MLSANFDIQVISILLSKSAIRIAETIDTIPGRMKLWFSKYFPIFVVPV